MALYFDRNGEPMTMEDWARTFEDNEYKRVALDEVGGYTVSTVWLGLDHSFGASPSPGHIFETMLFGDGDRDNETHRYSTEEQAKVGHDALVLALEHQSKFDTTGYE